MTVSSSPVLWIIFSSQFVPWSVNSLTASNIFLAMFPRCLLFLRFSCCYGRLMFPPRLAEILTHRSGDPHESLINQTYPFEKITLSPKEALNHQQWWFFCSTHASRQQYSLVGGAISTIKSSIWRWRRIHVFKLNRPSFFCFYGRPSSFLSAVVVWRRMFWCSWWLIVGLPTLEYYVGIVVRFWCLNF